MSNFDGLVTSIREILTEAAKKKKPKKGEPYKRGGGGQLQKYDPATGTYADEFGEQVLEAIDNFSPEMLDRIEEAVSKKKAKKKGEPYKRGGGNQLQKYDPADGTYDDEFGGDE